MNENVVITYERYRELLDLETRVNVAVERIVRCNYISMEDLLAILGTELAATRAEELHEEARKQQEEMFANIPNSTIGIEEV